jgi:PAS domain S-box-containing protein
LTGFSKASSRRPGWLMPMLNIALGLTLLAAGAWRSDRNLMHAQRQLVLGDQAYATELALTTLLSTLKDAETGQRGYLLTGDESYLAPYTLARAQISADFAALAAAPLQDPSRRLAIARLRRLTAEKFDTLDEALRLYRQGQAPAAIALVRSNRGEQLMDEIRTLVAAQQANVDRDLDYARLRGAPKGNLPSDGLLIAAACVLLGWTALQHLRATRRFAHGTDQLQRFTSAFGMGLGMIRSVDGRITVWSQGSERLYGYAAGEALGRPSHELLQTRFPVPLAEIEAELHANGHWHGELRHSRRDGSELRILTHWALHRGPKKAGDFVIEVHSDITSLTRTETLLRAILEAAPALIYAKDREGRMLVANPPTLELVGKPWTEIAGRTDMEFLSNPAEGAAIMENDRRLMTQGVGECLDEQVGLDETGGPRIWSSCKAPMFDGSGAVAGLVGVSIEITERRRVEARLRQQTLDLEPRAWRTGGFCAYHRA